ncbi:hypothetical protein KPL74_17715 [Bacillus sp. NP157]|nr:hypothetical protein KPL74_17715 [Bacillus sp. NP157]
MRHPLRVLCPTLMLATLAGCAAAPVAPAVAAAPTTGTISVSCTEDAISDAPCLGAARRDCPRPSVETIHLVLRQPEGDKAAFKYQATYTCPPVHGALVAPH